MGASSKYKSKEIIKRLNEENKELREKVDTLELQNKVHNERLYFRLNDKNRERVDKFVFELLLKQV